MVYHPSGIFSWDRVFKPSIMQRVLTFLGLKIDAIVIFVNYLQFAVTILLLLPYLPLAWLTRFVLGDPAVQKLNRVFGWVWLACFGVYRRRWRHPELDRDEPCLFMAEHFNLIDIPLYATTWYGDTRALSAREYKRVPMYGWVIATAGTLFIERRDRTQAIADLHALRDRMQNTGINGLVVPTGTRALDAQLPPFKRGVFYSAVELKKPIVPLYLIGLEHLVVGKYHCKPGRVDVVYGEPIRPEEHPGAFESVDALQALVHERMATEGRMLRLRRDELIAGRLAPVRT